MARPQINIRVDEERKERWKQAAEESPEYDGLTHLIRLAVEQELAEGEVPGVLPRVERQHLMRRVLTCFEK
ncbi:hypothetical protein VB779_01410 [Haloarculaceae archaeon H-GB11]|nr:hypothetical protein [Haloarculaceae archaeon H-GB11]